MQLLQQLSCHVSNTREGGFGYDRSYGAIQTLIGTFTLWAYVRTLSVPAVPQLPTSLLSAVL